MQMAAPFSQSFLNENLNYPLIVFMNKVFFSRRRHLAILNYVYFLPPWKEIKSLIWLSYWQESSILLVQFLLAKEKMWCLLNPYDLWLPFIGTSCLQNGSVLFQVPAIRWLEQGLSSLKLGSTWIQVKDGVSGRASGHWLKMHP